MECNVNATCICISYYSVSDTFFGNILVLFVICFLWLSCWTLVCLTTVQKKKIVFNRYLIPCSSELCSMLKHTQQNQSGVLHIAFTISSIWKNYFRWFYCQISCKWAFEVPYLSCFDRITVCGADSQTWLVFGRYGVCTEWCLINVMRLWKIWCLFREICIWED